MSTTRLQASSAPSANTFTASVGSVGMEQHPLSLSIVLHLLPGILIGLVFFLIGPFIQSKNFPPFIAQCIADFVVLTPFVLGILFYQGYKKNGRLSLKGIVLYREKISLWSYLLFVPIVLIASGLIPLLAPVSNFIYARLFSWWPPTYNLATDLSAYTRSTLIISYLVNFLVISLLAPILEELYFRGFLLPRLSRFGPWAVPIQSVLFAFFHFWTPWMVVARAVGLLPLIYVAQKRQNIYIGMIAHILANTLDVVAGVMFILKYK
jgi:membrane protease YdiL (CAAX protease family)